MPKPRMPRKAISHQMPGEHAEAIAPAASTSTSKPYTFFRPSLSARRPKTTAPAAEVSRARDDRSDFW